MLNTPVFWVPFVALLPVQAPEAVQLVAFSAAHDSVDPLPLTMEEGVAVSVKSGTGMIAVTVTLTDADVDPPAPLQVSE